MKTLNAALAAFLLTLLSCSGQNGDVAGVKGGSETTNGIAGTVAYPGGVPGAGARVYLLDTRYESGNGAVLVMGPVITSADGGFAFDSVGSGQFAVEALDGGGNGARVGSVVKTTEGQCILITDTMLLRPLAGVRGKVVMYSGDDPRTVDVFVMGSLRSAHAEADGSFLIDSLSWGVYRLRFRGTLDLYGVLDTQIAVAGDTLLGSIRLPYLSAPTPDTIAIAYDRPTQHVRISWPPVDSSLVGGYNIYRGELGANDTLLTRRYIPPAVTFYVDSSAIEGRTYEYHVVSLSRDGTLESRKRDFAGDTVAITGIDSLCGSFPVNAGAGVLCDLALLDSGMVAVAEKSMTPHIRVYDSTGRAVSAWWPSDSLLTVNNCSLAPGDSQTVFLCVTSSSDSLRREQTLVQCSYEGAILHSWTVPRPLVAQAPAIEPLIRYGGLKVHLVWFEGMFTTFDIRTEAISSFATPCRPFTFASNAQATLLFFTNPDDDRVVVTDTAGYSLPPWHALPAGVVAVDEIGTVFVASRTSTEVRIYAAAGQYWQYRARFRISDQLSGTGAMEIDRRGRCVILDYEKTGGQPFVQRYAIGRN